MKKIVLLSGLIGLSACDTTGSLSSGFMRDVPEEVLELAGPNQNLQTVKLLKDDGCYWYEHEGPVETTLLPLRTKRGGHICTQQSNSS